MDTYRNLTMKSIFGLKWVSTYCSIAQYILKTDDDTYFNIEALTELLIINNDTTILGSLNVNSSVQRQGLWQVDKTLFPNCIYPPYCSGCAYLIAQHLLPSMLAATEYIPLIPIEDVYITGILAKVIGLLSLLVHGTQ